MSKLEFMCGMVVMLCFVPIVFAIGEWTLGWFGILTIVGMVVDQIMQFLRGDRWTR